ncbi:Ig-like domain-containing protein [Nonomuraea rubra]|uniref:Ig-like domain-containing protein n=1 Tax=Nonomuraea rubra TaxID=46180 RepID=UPI0031EA047A
MGRGAYGTAGLLALALLTACSAGPAEKPEGVAMAGGARGAPVGVSPADKAADVPTDQPVVVSVHGGRLKSVQVQGGKAGPLKGVLSADGTRWRSVGTARPGTSYTVTAVSVDASGKASETRSAFTTAKGNKVFDIETITPNKDDTGLTVGVGMPVMIAFDKPIADRVAVERNLTVHSSKPVEGGLGRDRVTAWPAISADRAVAGRTPAGRISVRPRWSRFRVAQRAWREAGPGCRGSGYWGRGGPGCHKGVLGSLRGCGASWRLVRASCPVSARPGPSRTGWGL